MYHNNTRSIVDTIVPGNVAITTGDSPCFAVVSTDNLAGRRPYRATLAVRNKAVGSVEIQFYYMRNGVFSTLLTAPVIMDTNVNYAEFNQAYFMNIALQVGDLVFSQVVSCSGTAKGLTLSVDFR